MGRDTREKVFTALGIMLLVLFVGGIAIAITVLASIFAFAPTGAMSSGAGAPAGLGSLFGVLIAVGVIILVIALITMVLDIIAHFRVARVFDSKWFKLGEWLRVGTVLAVVIAIPLTILSILSMRTQGILGMLGPGANVFGLLFSLLWPMIIVLVISLLANNIHDSGLLHHPRRGSASRVAEVSDIAHFPNFYQNYFWRSY